jgi:voltage-gated potassium channel
MKFLLNKKAKKEDRIKKMIGNIIFDNDTWTGKLFDAVLLLFILVGTLVVILETVPDLRYKYGEILVTIEWIVVIFFVVEYALRIYSANSKKGYLFSFYGIIDFISITPVYLAFFVPSLHYLVLFRAFRMIRIFRVFKLLPLIQEQSSLYTSVKRAIPKIVIFLFFTFIASVVFSSIIYIVEGPENGFTDIPTSLYWTIVTITTVGYGDITPITPLGKTIASIIMLSGYGVIAVPTGIVVAEHSKTLLGRK